MAESNELDIISGIKRFFLYRLTIISILMESSCFNQGNRFHSINICFLNIYNFPLIDVSSLISVELSSTYVATISYIASSAVSFRYSSSNFHTVNNYIQPPTSWVMGCGAQPDLYDNISTTHSDLYRPKFVISKLLLDEYLLCQLYYKVVTRERTPSYLRISVPSYGFIKGQANHRHTLTIVTQCLLIHLLIALDWLSIFLHVNDFMKRMS